MKYTKYILTLIITIIFSINIVYAEDCYYIGDGFKATFDSEANDIYVDTVGKKIDHNSEDLLNFNQVGFRGHTTVGGHTFKTYLNEIFGISGLSFCPEYLVLQYCNEYNIWGTQDKSEAELAVAGINKVEGCTGKYAGYKGENGQKITAEDYYSTFIKPDMGGIEIGTDKVCDVLFGNPNDAGDESKNIPPSLAYMIHEIMTYVRIIVPILLVILGVLDLAKGVTASNADEMRKASKKFVKRIVAGILVFFVPVLVDLIMKLADIVWEGLGYAHCSFDL